MDTPSVSPSEIRSWWQRPFDATTSGIVALFSGVILWNALFPGFYYMVFLFALILFWGGFGTWAALRVTIAGIGNHLTGRPVSWKGAVGVLGLMIFVTVLVLTKLPLHAGFALARADFDGMLERDAQPGETFPLSLASAGPYGFYQQARRRCHDAGRVFITLSNDSGAGFVHSPNGIVDLCYNSGSKGHLAGDWYWMVED